MTPFTFAENSQLLELSKVSEDPESLSQVTKDIGDLVASHFLEGKGFDGTKLINITKGNLTDLPIEFYSLVMSQMQGQNIPKNS